MSTGQTITWTIVAFKICIIERVESSESLIKLICITLIKIDGCGTFHIGQWIWIYAFIALYYPFVGTKTSVVVCLNSVFDSFAARTIKRCEPEIITSVTAPTGKTPGGWSSGRDIDTAIKKHPSA